MTQSTVFVGDRGERRSFHKVEGHPTYSAVVAWRFEITPNREGMPARIDLTITLKDHGGQETEEEITLI